MDLVEIGVIIAVILGILVAAVCVTSIFMYFAWAWVVPDVFNGFVTEGLLPAKLTLWQSFKLMVLISVGGLGFAAVGASR